VKTQPFFLLLLAKTVRFSLFSAPFNKIITSSFLSSVFGLIFCLSSHFHTRFSRFSFILSLKNVKIDKK